MKKSNSRRLLSALSSSDEGLGLNGFEADLALLFGTGFADPNHAAADSIQFIVAWNDLDKLSAFEAEAASKTEPLGRPVHDKAGNPLGLRAEIYDHAGSLFHDDTFRATAFVRVEGGHSFVLNEDFHNTPIME